MHHCFGFFQAIGNRFRLAGHIQRRAGVQRDDVMRDADILAQRVDQHRRRLLGVFHTQIAGRGHGQAEILGMDFVLADLSAAQLADQGRRAEGNFVQTVAAVHHQGAFGAKALHEIYAKQRTPYTGRITVPVLWDKKTAQIVSNESADITRMRLREGLAALGVSGKQAKRFEKLYRDFQAASAQADSAGEGG